MHRLDLVVGPNGAGKSTFVALTLAPLLPRSLFVNADEIARQRWADDVETHAYEAAQIAAATRSTLVAQRRSFIAETVFSHPSKLDLITEAHAAQYTVVLHVLMVPEDLSVERVRHRVIAGGHSVPEDKIRGRHRRLGASWSARLRCPTPRRSTTTVDARVLESSPSSSVAIASVHRRGRSGRQLRFRLAGPHDTAWTHGSPNAPRRPADRRAATQMRLDR